MAEETTVKRGGRMYTIEDVKANSKVVGLAPTVQMANLDEALQTYEPELVFKLFLRQLKTDHKNAVRAKENGKVSAIGLIQAIAKSIVVVEDIQALVKRENITFTEAGQKLLQTDADPMRIHWDVGQVMGKDELTEDEPDEREEMDEKA